MSASVGEVPAGSAIVYMPFQTRSKICDRYKHKQSIGLGIAQIIIGILCIIFNSVSLGVTRYPGLARFGHGYWCGILFTITGIFGIIAGKKKTKCQIVTFMVFCIISAAFTIVLLVLGIIGAFSTGDINHPPWKRTTQSTYDTIVAMDSLLAICAIIEAIVAIWGSALCCRSGICCCLSPMVSTDSLVKPEREEMQQQQQQQQQQSALMSAPAGEVPAGSAMVYMPFQTRSKTYDRYKHEQSIGLGIAQIIIGILCIIFNSVSLGVTHYRGYDIVGHGYWCGILFTITGIFGIIAGKKKTRCQIITFMVLCIISAVFTIVLLGLGIFGAFYIELFIHLLWGKTTQSISDTIVAMDSLLAICAMTEAIVAIWGSALCCRSGICCCLSPMMFSPSAGYFPYTGQMIYIGQTQKGQYVYAPKPTFSHDQGTTPPPAYLQPGQAPSAYMASQEQPLWMIPPSATNKGLSEAQAPSKDPA